jgi:hypothetical protein
MSKAINRYKLQFYKLRHQELKKIEDFTNLTDEISILRILIEERLNMIEGPADVIAHSGAISDLIAKCDKLAGTIDKLQKSSGQVLDKQAILQFAEEVIGIIQDCIPEDPALMGTIADRIIGAIPHGSSDG